MSATYAAGQQHYYTLGAAVSAGTLEAKIVSAPVASTMVGPMVYSSGSSFGGAEAYYSSPSGALLLTVNSSHQYGGGFINNGGTPGSPVWFRVRFTSSSVFVSHSTDGTTWSSESSSAGGLSVTEIAFGSIFGSASATVEYIAWSPVVPDATVNAVAATSTATAVAPVVSAARTVDAPAATATASAGAPSVSGTGDATVAPPSASATAEALPPTLAWDSTVSAAVATATADALAPTVAIGATIAAPPATAIADAIAPIVDDGSGNQTINAPAATATAQAHAPVVLQVLETGTDTTNLRNGRRRLAYATVTVTRPVAAPPDTLTLATRVDKALAYPVPDMVDGRPT